MPRQILKVLVGSRAHGLNTDNSDYDWRGVFVTPTSDILSLGSKPDQTTWFEGKEDNTSFEVGKLLLMAQQCNPTILEMFRAEPSYEFDDDYSEEGFSNYGRDLQALFPHIWQPQRVCDAFIGYGLNQRKKFLEDKDVRPAKYATAYLRTLIIAEQLLSTGTFSLDVSQHSMYGILKRWRGGSYKKGEVIDLCGDMEKEVRISLADHPTNPDYNPEKVNQFLLKIRQENWLWQKQLFS